MTTWFLKLTNLLLFIFLQAKHLGRCKFNFDGVKDNSSKDHLHNCVLLCNYVNSLSLSLSLSFLSLSHTHSHTHNNERITVNSIDKKIEIKLIRSSLADKKYELETKKSRPNGYEV